MKKILSAVLACAATMSIASFAFAEDANVGEDAPAAPESTVTVGDTDPAGSEVAPITSKITVGKDGLTLKGDALAEAILKNEDGVFALSDVESIVFTSEAKFKVTLDVKAGSVAGDADATKFVVDVNELAKADEDAGFATTHTVTADMIAVMSDENVMSFVGEDGAEIEVTAVVTLKEDAEPTPEQKPTGIALAIAPAGLAVAFVTVAAVMNKKKRG